MLKAIIYFHMLSYPVLFGGRCSSGPKMEEDREHNMFSNVCPPYVQRWLRRSRGLLSLPYKIVPNDDVYDSLSIGCPLVSLTTHPVAARSHFEL